MEPFSVTLAADLLGVAVFAASGASAAVARRFDMFGVSVIGIVTALGGGATRDVLIGDIPPLLLTDWRYPAVAITSALVVFYFHPAFSRLYRSVLILDAAGLAIFTVLGTQKGLEFGLSGYAACMVGILSGVGGGMVRDILTQTVPVILREDFYALAALIGSVIVVIGYHWDPTPGYWASGLFAGAVVFISRLLAIRYRWSAPKPRI
ncbi:trimeric intracellular cation channel family protein [Haloglycomyces albus]|uniref:trimeric intracellular cation channel family protein n=1 Tax=Haloglycomyces albus TaxID=526067 RepID=UPI00046D5BED|nr:trimeric intracellular cation channel family protein [Haloglycomyces albus]